ncbi:MAG: hypothetical protein OXM03_11240 [Chloroflexota bacterium]|nr:hypothetical protein [Chloroflexota bacterium]MDE2841189.1 hypothetical protein [Chloroflexota bacterium]MDE2929628.1 hypothetical protein [Chloroflexota bacterium]
MADGNGQALAIGFLTLLTINKEGERLGAVLITDERGVPLEFRVTAPVRISQVQRVIYGASLEPHVGVDIIGRPLIGKVEANPEILLVNKPFLVELRDAANCPVIFLRRVGETLSVGGDSSGVTVESKRTQPVSLEADPEYKDDIREAADLFRHLADSIDLFEPFERIKKAVDVLQIEDERFR